MTKSRYICAACGQTFTEGWTDEEAAAEFAATFPGKSLADADRVCDGCYKEIMAFHDHTPGQPK